MQNKSTFENDDLETFKRTQALAAWLTNKSLSAFGNLQTHTGFGGMVDMVDK